MKKIVRILMFFLGLVFLPINKTLAIDGVSCTEPGATYALCASGIITKITYRKADDAVLVSGFDSPGCGAGWVLMNPTLDENKKQMYATLLTAYMSKKSVSLTRAGAGTCVPWDGGWKGPITEISLD
jgi:hypothetical protein